MTFDELLSHISEKNINLGLDGDQLDCQGAENEMTPEFLDELRQHKAELVIFLRQANIDSRANLPDPIHRIAPETENIPLSFAQEPLWFLEQLQPGNVSNYMATALHLNGLLNHTALEKATNEIIRRHDILRTIFMSRDGSSIQLVKPPFNLQIPEIDLRELSFSTDEQKIQGIITADIQKSFDLNEGPLLRINLLQFSIEEHVLVLTMHHIISDGISFGLFFRELSAIYTAITQEKNSSFLHDLPVQYRDFALWERQWLNESIMNKQLSYWKKILKGKLPIVELPIDKPRPTLQSHRGARRTISISQQNYQDLTLLSQKGSCSLFMTLVAILQTLLYRYTSEEDIIVGSPIVTRNHPEIEKSIGLFLNVLVLRSDLSGDPSFLEIMERVRSVTLGAFSNQDLPFEKLVEELQPERDLSRNSLFQVSLELSQEEKLEMPGLTITTLEVENGGSQFDLSIHLREGENGLSGHFEYDTDLFYAETIDRMIGHFQKLIESVTLDPNQSISSLPILTDQEQSQLIFEWNKTLSQYPSDLCMVDLFEQQVNRIPTSTAVRLEDNQLSYNELNEKANQFARRLRSSGVEKGMHVGICLEPSIDMLISLLGVMKVGGAYIPIDPDYPIDRTTFMINDSKLVVLVTQENNIAKFPKYEGKIVCVDRDQKEIAGEDKDNLSSVSGPEDIAYVIYTSGSTGKPKGVAISHGALVNFLWSMSLKPGLEENDVLVSVTTLSFDIAALELYLPLIVGAQVALVNRETAIDGIQLMATLERQSATVMQATPATWRLLLESGWEGSPKLKILCGGEPLPYDLANELLARGKEVWNMYGPTETTIWSTLWKVNSNKGTILIGRPIANTQIYILDGKMQQIPIGVSGELHIGGHGLASEYFQSPDLTLEKFIPNPFSNKVNSRLYKTGDLARYRPDGNIEYLGRIDHQVKIRGHRIELGEIEACIDANSKINQCVVVAREDTPGDQRLAAYLVLKEKKVSKELIQKELVKKLPEYMIPSVFVILDNLPLTPNGKIDRKALPIPGKKRRSNKNYLAPRKKIEKLIADIWKQQLQIEKVGVHDNFFDLGGHSLLMAKVHSALREKVCPELTMVDLFRYPTIKKLNQFLTQDHDSHTTPTQKIQKKAKSRGIIRRESKGNRTDSLNKSTADIAIIGMAGRFPGAENIEEFWQNLHDGVESIVTFSDEELLDKGLSAAIVNDPAYVKAGTILKDFDHFDAPFFGLNAREAEITDPQHRLFLEASWHALEDAGYNPDRHRGAIGIFAGTGMNHYLYNLYSQNIAADPLSSYQKMIGNDSGFLTTRVSYHLNLKGPSVTVQSACSTSLVAVHMACENLLANKCDMALAGGVGVFLPHGEGYFHHEGMIMSPDGHCRAFDANGQGVVAGSGLGIVVLKRLSDALAEGDTIRAIIKGSAINNDGADKVGYTAPSIHGQAAAIAEALSQGKINPETITYVEAHGTGTPLGDPIEIAALTQVFRKSSKKKGYCAIGSVKTNFGHLDAAAGIAGLIKTVLALQHRKIPPSLNFESPNPKIDFENSPFFVNSQLKDWKSNGTPRRAGVSSFGIGGTNAHVVLEEAPQPKVSTHHKTYNLLLLSAKSESALEESTKNLTKHLKKNKDIKLSDVAYTLQIGRKVFPHRRYVVVGQDIDDALDAMSSIDSGRVKTTVQDATDRDIVFMFPGQGSQYVNMGLELYNTEPVFQTCVDRCSQILAPNLGFDLKEILYPENKNAKSAQEKLKNTLVTQPALFAIEYSLAKLWMSWGLQPIALVGHSIGEYVAACLAGVFTLEDTLGLVSARGRLIQDLSGGSMLTVPLTELEVTKYLNPKLSLAAVNSPKLCVVSGEKKCC